MVDASPFASLLRHWRTTLRLSQAALAEEAEISARHLSFLETGRSRPSQQMVLILGSALELPLRERNALLQAAGFAPAYRETDLSAPELGPVRQAVDFMLEAHLPFPAVLVDAQWHMLRDNPAHGAAWRLLTGAAPSPGDNLLRAVFDPVGLRPRIRNLDEVGPLLLDRLRREGLVDERSAALLDEIAALPDVPAAWLRPSTSPPTLLVPMVLDLDGQVLSLFSTIATLGTPQDVTLQELRLETFFPADAESEALLRALGGAAVAAAEETAPAVQ